MPDTGFQSLSVELGFWIPIVSGILDTLNCIPDSKAQELDSAGKISWISDSTRKNFPDSRIQVP